MKHLLLNIAFLATIGIANCSGQANPLLGQWNVIGENWVQLPFDSILMVREPENPNFHANEGSGMIFDAKRCTIYSYAIPDSAKGQPFLSGETEMSYAYSTYVVSNSLNLLQFGQDGCERYAFYLQSDSLILTRFSPKVIEIEFQEYEQEPVEPMIFESTSLELAMLIECNPRKEVELIVSGTEAELELLGKRRFERLLRLRTNLVIRALKRQSSTSRRFLEAKIDDLPSSIAVARIQVK